MFLQRDSVWTDAAHQASLRVFDVAPYSDAYFELPIQMNFQGDFLNVYAFLSEVEHLSRLTRVRKLAIHTKDIKSGLVEVEIGLNIYYSEG